MRTYQPTLFCYLNHTFFGIAHFFQPALLAVLVYIVFHINQLQAATWGLIFLNKTKRSCTLPTCGHLFVTDRPTVDVLDVGIPSDENTYQNAASEFSCFAILHKTQILL